MIVGHSRAINPYVPHNVLVVWVPDGVSSEALVKRYLKLLFVW